jgi:hypothetical protein
MSLGDNSALGRTEQRRRHYLERGHRAGRRSRAVLIGADGDALGGDRAGTNRAEVAVWDATLKRVGRCFRTSKLSS